MSARTRVVAAALLLMLCAMPTPARWLQGGNGNGNGCVWAYHGSCVVTASASCGAWQAQQHPPPPSRGPIPG